MFLKELDHPNIVRIKEVFEAENNIDIYIVCDFVKADLHNVIRSRILQDCHKQVILYGILKALKYMHSGHLIHRDLKPSNVLVNEGDCSVKICDFGLARSVDPAQNNESSFESAQVLTDYVATRWYRAPELLLGSITYTKAIDIWAVACIVAEMELGKPAFPGTSTLNQLEKIVSVTGRPSPEDLETINSPQAEKVMSEASPPGRTSLEEMMTRASADAIDLMRRCLRFNIKQRPTVDDLLEHKFVKPFRQPSEEIACPRPIRIPIDDNMRLRTRDYMQQIYRRIRRDRDSEIPSTNSVISTPPKDNFLSPTASMKDYSHRSSNLTPTTSHTSKGTPSAVTPSSSKLVKSASKINLNPAATYITNSSVTRKSSVALRPRAASTSLKPTSASPVELKPSVNGLLGYHRPSTSSVNSRLTRSPSSSGLGGRSRAASPAVQKRPATSYTR